MSKYNNIKVLDCTLRDGGHVNNADFGKKIISLIIDSLIIVIYSVENVQILWFQLLFSDYFLVSLVFYNSKLMIFGLWTVGLDNKGHFRLNLQL